MTRQPPQLLSEADRRPSAIAWPPERRSADELPVAVIGAGPVGLAAAAHLLARGIEPVVLEAGPKVGTAVRSWGHVPMFSPWRYNVDRAATALLERSGWATPDLEGFPTGLQLAEAYLEPLASTVEIAPRLRLGRRVTGVARVGLDKVRTAGREDAPFEVRTIDFDGGEERLFARAVIDASGTWGRPNPAGAGGLPARGEGAAGDRIRYGMPDVLGAERARYAGRSVLVVGSGHSAVGTLLDLADMAAQAPGTRIAWALRRREFGRIFGGGAADQLPQRGALGSRLRKLVDAGAFELVAPFLIDAIARAADGSLVVEGESGDDFRTVAVDEMVVATGLRPDLAFLGELRLDLDPALDCPTALAPLIDPNLHSCGTVRPHGAAELAQPEPGLYLVGMKSYGRAPTFLLATGYEQVRSIAARLAGDLEAAARVELSLPETGVCSGPVARAAAAEGCCGGPAPVDADGCCLKDAVAKAVGDDGCRCAPAKVEPEPESAVAAACCGAA